MSCELPIYFFEIRLLFPHLTKSLTGFFLLFIWLLNTAGCEIISLSNNISATHITRLCQIRFSKFAEIQGLLILSVYLISWRYCTIYSIEAHDFHVKIWPGNGSMKEDQRAV